MSLIPFMMMGKSGKGSDLGEGLAFLLASPAILAGKTLEGFEAIKNTIVKRAEIRSNKKEFEEIKNDYIKLSEGKVGTVETFKDEKTGATTTIIHTENGPFTKIEKAGNIVHDRNGETFQQGTSVSYTGLREVTDKEGNTTLAFLNGVSVAESQPFSNFNHDTIVAYNTEGTIVTEAGLKSDYEGVTSVYEGQPAPTGGAFDVVNGASADFAAELAKIGVQIADNSAPTGIEDTVQ